MYPDVMPMRRELLSRYMDVSKLTILEIGAYDRPVYTPSEADVSFLDYRTTKDLRKLAVEEQGRNANRIPEVRYVAKSNALSKEVDRKFDLIIANHVFEHIPDIIQWLSETQSILYSSGWLLLSIPDRRYTFDYLRRETSIVDALRWFQLELQRPCFEQILDYYYYRRPITGVEGWHPEVLSERLRASEYSLDEVVKLASRLSREGYHDVHCGVYTRESFVKLFEQLTELRAAPFRLVEISGIQPGMIEFQVLLKLNSSFDPADLSYIRSSTAA